jgi:hypothetical protein
MIRRGNVSQDQADRIKGNEGKGIADDVAGGYPGDNGRSGEKGDQQYRRGVQGDCWRQPDEYANCRTQRQGVGAALQTQQLVVMKLSGAGKIHDGLSTERGTRIDVIFMVDLK